MEVFLQTPPPTPTPHMPQTYRVQQRPLPSQLFTAIILLFDAIRSETKFSHQLFTEIPYEGGGKKKKKKIRKLLYDIRPEMFSFRETSPSNGACFDHWIEAWFGNMCVP
jgi:hypothetical protein